MELLKDLKKNKMFVNGKWVESANGTLRSVKNPADGSEVGSYFVGDKAIAKKALETANIAFTGWRKTSARDRARLLREIGNSLIENKEELSTILTLENGKPINESLGEVNAAASHFEWFAEEATRMYGRIVPPSQPEKRHLIIKQPIGVTACISPWNFPLVLWARKIAPALAAGCTVISRPASQTTLIAIAALKIIEGIGLPDGVLNLVTGPAAEVVGEFLENPICSKISFTGSTEIGRELMRKGADSIKHLSLELGGNAPAIVFEDADMDTALKGVLHAKFRNGGQSCIAINRIYVHKNIAEEFTNRLLGEIKKIKVGNGLDMATELGPMVDKKSIEKFMQHVEDAVKKGARLLYGGKRILEGEFGKGNFVEPALITGVRDDMLCMCEETFGPMAPLSTFETFDEVIKRANNTEYGLSAYLYTTSLKTAFEAGEALEAGTIGVNDEVPSTTIAPFGGFKQSGLGRECGQEGLEAFLETKHISMVL